MIASIGSIAALAHGRIGQTHDTNHGLPRGNVNLHLLSPTADHFQVTLYQEQNRPDICPACSF